MYSHSRSCRAGWDHRRNDDPASTRWVALFGVEVFQYVRTGGSIVRLQRGVGRGLRCGVDDDW